MSLAIKEQLVPLRVDQDDVVRVGGTRVTLDTVVTAFEQGATAAEIVDRYSVLSLADVYLVLGYYLHHRTEIETYLQARQQQAAEVRRQNEARFPSDGIRERLLARYKKDM